METLIWAAEECDIENEVMCAPEEVEELFEFLTPLFSIGPFDFTKTVILIFLAMFIVVGLLYFGLRRKALVPTRFEAAIEGLVTFVKDDIALGIIGPEGMRFYPYLLSLFMFILIGNIFEITPFINFPITSRMAIPLFLALLTWVIFVFVGFARNGFSYFLDIIWPRHVPIFMRWLVGLIEVASVFILRPVTLAVRLFANMVAGHLMLTLLLTSAYFFLTGFGEVGLKAIVGIPWFVLALGIFLFEVAVSLLQAYIFTLLSAVYIQSSVHPEH